MKAAPPPSQADRLNALRSLDVLDTPREEAFDEIVELASRICETPISVINLIDEHRQWFKAETGLGVRETPLDTSICAHVILEHGLTIIPDTLEDPRMADNPLCFDEPHLRFYAGAVLKSDDGQPIGTLCVLDHKPRDLSELQRFALKVLARQVMAQLRARKRTAAQKAALELADEEVEELREAAQAHDILVQEVDHRVKNSLNTVASMLNIQAKSAISEEVATHLSTARDRVLAVAALHEQLHMTAKHDKVDMAEFVGRLVDSMAKTLPSTVTMHQHAERVMLNTKAASSVGIIINELATNSLKYAFPNERRGQIGIECGNSAGTFKLTVWDDGIGFMPNISNGRPMGLGMRVVQSSVEQLDGGIEHVDNQPGSRTQIVFPLG